MKPLARFAAMLTGLVLLLTITPSWGGPPNPTPSDANFNTAGGEEALLNVVVSGSTQGFDNTAFGSEALLNNTTGSNNTASGSAALVSNTTGSDNTASGTSALHGNKTGNSNTANGVAALAGNTTGNSNTASGAYALVSNKAGNSNTANGVRALAGNTTGNSNTASGAYALTNNTTGNSNTASGVNALSSNITGIRNTAVGRQALESSTGKENIAIGWLAGATLTSGDDNIYLANVGTSSESKTMRLGNVQTRTFIAGIATATVSGTTVEVDTKTGQLGITPSSARYKQDIAPMGTSSEKVLDLRPVTFAYKEDAQHVKHYGLVAEEVAAVYPELVTHTAAGEVQAVRYQELIPMLLNELQRQQQAFQRQEQTLQRQQQELADLRVLVGQGRETASLSR